MGNAPNFDTDPVVIVGGGFTGLTAAYELGRAGHKVVVLEKEATVGGLASAFPVGGTELERFYHHWFTNDVHIMELIRELGREREVVFHHTRTGMYYANSTYRLSTPWDLLSFKALSPIGRLRLGMLALRARAIKDWRQIEHMTAREWLIKLAGREVFETVWEPLLVGKFGPYADKVGAVWFWKKLALRGGSRAADGREALAYYKGGFAALAQAITGKLQSFGVDIRLNAEVNGLVTDGQRLRAVQTSKGLVPATAALLTQPLPSIANLLEPFVNEDYTERLRRIDFLANICLVLILDRSLSDTYWLNVNDPQFPFVGVIEHTNFVAPETYEGRHVVYLSKYLPEESAIFQMDDESLVGFSVPHLKRMFPKFERDWIVDYHVWRERFTQPIAEPFYSRLIPDEHTPLENVLVTTMAQIYPEDRGTNYAVREGRRVGRKLDGLLRGGEIQPSRTMAAVAEVA